MKTIILIWILLNISAVIWYIANKHNIINQFAEWLDDKAWMMSRNSVGFDEFTEDILGIVTPEQYAECYYKLRQIPTHHRRDLITIVECSRKPLHECILILNAMIDKAMTSDKQVIDQIMKRWPNG